MTYIVLKISIYFSLLVKPPQVDNCVSENKNIFFVGYAGLLVATSVIRVVEINFMMVGHTHTKIDKVFSR